MLEQAKAKEEQERMSAYAVDPRAVHAVINNGSSNTQAQQSSGSNTSTTRSQASGGGGGGTLVFIGLIAAGYYIF